MSPTKRFMLGCLGAYAALLVVGLFLFRTPGYSKEYMSRFGEEHERFHKILKSDAFKAFEANPVLEALPEAERENIEFAEHYMERPEYRAEKRRMMAYLIYFRTVNSAVFLLLLGYALKGPIAAGLDRAISDIRKRMEKAAELRRQAAERKAEAKRFVDQWEQEKAALEDKTKATVEHDVAEIRERGRLALEQLERETEDRKHAEMLKSAYLIREELVNEAMRRLEERYRTETTEADLSRNVDQLVRILETLS